MSSAVLAYRRALCEVAHKLLWSGYLLARPRINPTEQEEAITGFILEGMFEVLDDPHTGSAFNRYEPHEEWRVVDSRTGRRRKRIDIVVRMTEGSPRPKFCFEAKRLKAGSHGIGDYTGIEGMGCYLNEDYAKEDPDAAMVAYIQSHDASRWLSKLQGQYNCVGNPLCCIAPPSAALLPISIHAPLTNEWFSDHTRPSRGDIKLYHIFLDCT